MAHTLSVTYDDTASAAEIIVALADVAHRDAMPETVTVGRGASKRVIIQGSADTIGQIVRSVWARGFTLTYVDGVAVDMHDTATLYSIIGA